MKCPACKTEVLEAVNGRLLNPQRSRFGRYLRDGTTATGETIRTRVPAYFEHTCTTPQPQPTTDQPALF